MIRAFASRCGLLVSVAALSSGFGLSAPANAQISYFTPGDLVVTTVVSPTGLTDASQLDLASPIDLREYNLGVGGTTASVAGSMVLPQTQNGANWAISGEYGSASEGFLQLSANGQYLTMMGYGVNANTFNTAAANNGSTPSPYGTTALGQTTSVTGGSSTVVPRVVALIGTNGGTDTTTALTGVFNMNNPRSSATVDGSSFYVAGQGVTGDGTGGVFYAVKGATTATPINTSTATPSGNPNGTANPLYGTEARAVEIVNTGSGNQLEVSRDFGAKGSPNDATDIRTLTNASGGLPTSSNGLVAFRVDNTISSGGNTGSIDLTAATYNGINNTRSPPKNTFVYLSPEEFWYANPTTLYVADSGSPKNGSANAAALGEGGLQKWTLSNGIWSLDYDLVTGLNLANNANANSATPTAPGVTGLFGLTGEVVGGDVELFATTYGLNELSQSYLYEVTDELANTNYTVAADESFNLLDTAPAGTLFRGVSFTPAPEPASITIFGIGLLGAGIARRRRARR